MVYHYCRVSSKDQCLDRQLEALYAYKRADKVFCDKQSGKNFDRVQYQALKSVVLPGDEIVVKELDRLGRNKEEIKQELQWFKTNKVAVRILDIPTTLLDLGGQEWVAEMVNNVLIEVMGAIAEQERVKIRTRQREGIAAMKQRGEWDRYGRPKLEVPLFAEYHEAVRGGKKTVSEAVKELGITKSKWYRLCRGA